MERLRIVRPRAAGHHIAGLASYDLPSSSLGTCQFRRQLSYLSTCRQCVTESWSYSSDARQWWEIARLWVAVFLQPLHQGAVAPLASLQESSYGLLHRATSSNDSSRRPRQISKHALGLQTPVDCRRLADCTAPPHLSSYLPL